VILVCVVNACPEFDGQGRQALLAVVGEYVPAPQATHTEAAVAPTAVECVPALQSVHASLLMTDLYLPATHRAQNSALIVTLTPDTAADVSNSPSIFETITTGMVTRGVNDDADAIPMIPSWLL